MTHEEHRIKKAPLLRNNPNSIIRLNITWSNSEYSSRQKYLKIKKFEIPAKHRISTPSQYTYVFKVNN
ncbi:hypothetical protein NARC_150028 [Candidatus Nitrosocosmicus arcticus]|uniref:Uncharacterized protein n=1 Tax=Candidatus Nitrosocosmicus arcticus TaxID=2035267 RepID=A0A557SS49_9ARCH|nr:hypothetical protein NARC_150028 [Candidatus Nitrosocosmicus arcticus]